jgi:hypothetical protein
MLSLLALLLVNPFFQRGPAGESMMALLNSVTLVAGVYALGTTPRYLILSLLIAVPHLLLAWTAIFSGNATVGILSVALLVLFYGFAVVRVLAYVLGGQQVTRDKIHGAVSVYLLMGLSWASTYMLFQLLQRGSFFMDQAHNPKGRIEFPELVHLSFATLTTLGYGDVTPISALARSLATLEAVSGVLYLAVLVARLVSLYRPK